MATSAKLYRLDGTLLQACSCDSPCPCLVGLDPDRGHCDAVTAYHVDRGEITGVDVSGRSVVQVIQVPGNIRDGRWHQILYVDDRATPDQRGALIAAFDGTLGGPLAELAELVEDRIATHSVPMAYSVQDFTATLQVGGRAVASAAGAPRTGAHISVTVDAFRDDQGRGSKLDNVRCTVIPGSSVYLGQAPEDRVEVPEHLQGWTFSHHNGIQGAFHVEA